MNFTYLACANLLSSLNFVSLEEDPDDLGWMYFKYKGGEPVAIKLKFYNKSRFDNDLGVLDVIKSNPDKQSKDIHFKQIYHKDFQTEVKYNYIFLTKSPEYAPVESDDLIPIIKEYMEEV